MWVPKYERDWKKGVDSPMPTQVVSNEEFIPRPQSKPQAQVEKLIMEMGEANAKKIGMDRRKFMRTSMGMATAFMASNAVYGPHWNVAAEEQFESAATDEKFPKGEYFVIDAQAHFTNGVALPGFRDNEFVKNMGFDLKNDAEAYSFQNFVKEMLFDSETSMVIISGVPGREKQADSAGTPLEGKARGGGVLPSWLMSQRKKDINDMANSQRALCQGNCAPNHYWDAATGKPDYPALFEQMEREVKVYGIDSWKWYCHTDPGRSGNGFQLDDDMAAKFYEKSRELGMKNISVHKGFSYQSRVLGHLANPKDVEKAALNNPDFNFIIYHSALKHGPNEPDYEKMNEFNPETGDFLWHSILMDVKKRNPGITNVYPEIGSSFATLALVNPIMCQHLIGKNIQTYGADHVIWGTDCLWWGTPQWAIDAMKRFQIDDSLCEKFGYAKVTTEDKKKIFGENIAKVYKVDLAAKRNALPKDALTAFQGAYLDKGGERSNMTWGWVREEA